MSEKIKAVVFDLDNTLYDYDSCNQHAEKILLHKISKLFAMSEERVCQRLYIAKKAVKRRLGCTASAHNRLLYMQAFCEQIGENPLSYAMALYDCYWDAMLGKMELFDYVLPLMNDLRKRNIKIAILTDLTAHIQYRKIKKLGLTEHVDLLVTSEEAGEEKPSSKMYCLLLEKLEMRADTVLMIGDSYEKDVIGAERMGMKAVQYKKGMSVKERVMKLL